MTPADLCALEVLRDTRDATANIVADALVRAGHWKEPHGRPTNLALAGASFLRSLRARGLVGDGGILPDRGARGWYLTAAGAAALAAKGESRG